MAMITDEELRLQTQKAIDFANLTVVPEPNPLWRPFASVDAIQPDEFDTMHPKAKELWRQRRAFGHLHGYLEPLSSAHARIDFWKPSTQFSIGRRNRYKKPGDEGYIENAVAIPAPFISQIHVIFKVHKDGGLDCICKASNGFMVNNRPVMPCDAPMRIYDGQMFRFDIGYSTPADPRDDFRYIYRECSTASDFRKSTWFYDTGVVLGAGGFGSVSVGTHRMTGQKFAVKHIILKKRNDSHDTHMNQMEYMMREITNLLAFRHPNVVLLYEWYLDADQSVDLVLEYVDGGDLDSYIEKSPAKRIPEEMVQHISYQLCQGLSYLHRGGLTHRDLKPANILLTSDEWPKVKITDFGIAKVTDGRNELQTHVGTPMFMAPEIITGRPYTDRVDSWSLGMTLYTALACGTLPRRFGEVPQTIGSVSVSGFEYPINLGAILQHNNVSRQAIHFVGLLLSADPRGRPGMDQCLQHSWFLPPFLARYGNFPEWHECEEARQAQIRAPQGQRDAIRFINLPPLTPEEQERAMAIQAGIVHGGGGGEVPTVVDSASPQPTLVDLQAADSVSQANEDPNTQTIRASSQASSTPPRRQSPRKKMLAKATKPSTLTPQPRKVKSTVAKLVGQIPGAWASTIQPPLLPRNVNDDGEQATANQKPRTRAARQKELAAAAVKSASAPQRRPRRKV